MVCSDQSITATLAVEALRLSPAECVRLDAVNTDALLDRVVANDFNRSLNAQITFSPSRAYRWVVHHTVDRSSEHLKADLAAPLADQRLHSLSVSTSRIAEGVLLKGMTYDCPWDDFRFM